jgi:hypothetical protein
MPRLFFDISDSTQPALHGLASWNPQGKATAQATLRATLPAELSAGNGNPAEDCIMENQTFGNILQSDTQLSTTLVGWDEFRKLAKVGDIIQEPGQTLRITEKVFEPTASGEQFAIHIYAR